MKCKVKRVKKLKWFGMERDKFVQLVSSVNGTLFVVYGLGHMLLADTIVPGLNDESRVAVRSFGACALFYALLGMSLGHLHHGMYCLTMSLHFTLACINGIEALVRPQVTTGVNYSIPAVGHCFMSIVMLAVLMNGGLPGHKEPKKHE